MITVSNRKRTNTSFFLLLYHCPIYFYLAKAACTVAGQSWCFTQYHIKEEVEGQCFLMHQKPKKENLSGRGVSPDLAEYLWRETRLKEKVSCSGSCGGEREPSCRIISQLAIGSQPLVWGQYTCLCFAVNIL